MNRYVELVVATDKSYTQIFVMYIFLSNVITIAGVLITALLSLDKISAGSEITTPLFWVVWGLSVALTLANKWLHSFGIQKKYIVNAAMLEKLKSEGWSFLAGVGKYSGMGGDSTQRFETFMARVEHIKLRSFENLPEMGISGVVNDILATGGGDLDVVVEMPILGGDEGKGAENEVIIKIEQ